MLATLGRLLVALALAGAGLLLTGAPAQACTCAPDTSLRTQARDADVVFSGVLVREQGTRRLDTFTFDAQRVYQGRVPDAEVEVVSSARTSCAVGPLRRDRAYVVFAAQTSARLETARCYGTGRATPAYVEDVERVLGPGTAIPKPPPPSQEPAKPEYTRVKDADPPPFTRLAAPGGALVLVGLLGLVLFRKRG